MKLVIDHVCCGYGKRQVVRDFCATVSSGQVLCLLGPNGVGKTTLFKTVLGFLKPQSGHVYVDDVDIHTLPRQEFAKLISYVPQAHTPPFPFKVIDVVLMGRTVHLGQFGSPGKEDRRIAEEALEQWDVSFLRDRTYTEISGGERQMVLIARALTQKTHFLMMDEPTSNLDFGNQVKVLQCVSDLAKQAGLGVIMTTHFPDHVFQCDGTVALMKSGESFVTGDSHEIITPQNMHDAYGIDVRVLHNTGEEGQITACVPLIHKPHDSGQTSADVE